jgi:beta-lactamase class A
VISTPPPPIVISPGPSQVSFGAIWGTVGRGVERVVVRIDGHKRAVGHPRGRHFSFSVSLPRRDFALRVTAIAPHGSRSTVVRPVFGLPRRASPRRVAGYRERRLARPVRKLVRGFPGIAAAYVEDLGTGAGAAWNAGARFPAASTLKLAIAVELLRSLRGPPPSPRSYYGSLMTAMLDESDNVAANQLLVAAGGSWRVNTTMRLLGLRDTEMFGGYLPGTAPLRRRDPIPVHVNDQPYFGIGKYTTAHDLARLLKLVHLAAGGKGPIIRRLGTFTEADARYLLYLLAHVDDPEKLGRFVHGGGVAVLHKAGWISHARHDAGLVYWPGGVFVATVMTWSYGGVGTSSDVLAGRVARAVLTSLHRHRGR